MRLELRLKLESNSWKDFRVGAIFTKDELIPYECNYQTPKDWTWSSVGKALKNNVIEDVKGIKDDLSHLLWWCKTRYTYLKYRVEEIKLTKEHVIIFLIALSPIAIASTIAVSKNDLATNVAVVETVQKSKVAEITKKIEKKKRKAKKAKIDLIITEVSKKTHALNNTSTKELAALPKIKLKPVTSVNYISGISDVQVAQIKSVSGTIDSKELKKVKLFSSREDAIVGYFMEYKKDEKLMKSVSAINSIAQFIYEPGMTEDGTVSKLASIGNQGGVKKGVWSGGKLRLTRKLEGESEGMVMSHDDETNKSAFKTFSTVPNFMRGHADFLSTPRYKNYRKYAGINTEWAAKQAARELAPDKAGYFTTTQGHVHLQKIISTIVVPVLKKNKLI